MYTDRPKQVSSGSLSTRRYGASMYREMFCEFSDSVLYRQEVVGALITHCGAGSDMETDSALSALSALASPRYNMCGGAVCNKLKLGSACCMT